MTRPQESNVPAESSPPGDRVSGNTRRTGPWVEILQETVRYAFHGLFRIVEARLRYRRFDGRMSKLITRVNFERCDAVGVLLYDTERDAVVLVRQFRYPVYAALSTEARQGKGAREAWLLEIVAGVIEGDRSAPEVGRRELLEEAGYAVEGALNFIATIYPSPGGSSERIHLYWAEVRATEPAGAGGGLEDEGEDTEVVVLPFRAAMDMMARGEIYDGKTIVALQHLALRQAQSSQDANVQKRPSV
jgi:nudix-type nucleoside diphosphatase (YffH/AdpP family)